MLEIISLISVIIAVIFLRRIVDILPSAFACTLRWRECIRIDASLKTSRDRDFTALVLIIPILLTTQKYEIIPYRFFESMTSEEEFLVLCAVFAGYLAFRSFASALFLSNKNHKKSRTPDNSDRTFFIILSVLILSFSWIMSIIGIETTVIKSTIIWISAATYMLYFVRKFQIFQSSRSIFSAFLYLCALEIVPTVILVVSAIIF